MRLHAGGALFVNDSANANMTIGLTLNQGANDDDIIGFKSSDVAHGMTSLRETDTWGVIKQANTDSGGLLIDTYAENHTPLQLIGRGGTEATDDTTSTLGEIHMSGQLKSGTSADVLQATGNVCSFANHGTTRVVFKGDGTVHASDTSWATGLDDMPDALAARAYTTEMAHRQGEGLLAGMEVHAPELVQRMEDAGIVTHAELPGEGTIPGHRFLNLQKGIKFAWDMGFQQMDYMGELMKVLEPEQVAKLPARMRSHFAMLEEHKATEIKQMEN
jgi:hypothetical protein